MKDIFCFILKALFILKMFKLLPCCFGQIEKRLDQKDKVNFRFYEDTVWLKTTIAHLLPNISEIKDNQTVKFGHLIENNKSKLFL